MGKTLASRPLDFIYFGFFLVSFLCRCHCPLAEYAYTKCHIPATLFVDLPAIYPRSYVPDFMFKLPEFYVKMSGDPLIGGVSGTIGDVDNFAWFKSFLLLEL